MQKITLGKDKEILDAELWDISEAVIIAKKKYAQKHNNPLLFAYFVTHKPLLTS